VLWGTFVATSFHDLRSVDIARIAPTLFFAVIMCLPQLYVLVMVHLPWHLGNLMGSAPYSFSLLYSIPQSISTLTVGNAVFPIDYVPCLFLLLLTAASFSSATRMLRDQYVIILLGGTLLGLMLMVVTGIGVEGRNAVFLYPVALTLIILIISRSVLWIRWPAMATLVLLQIMSVYGFVFHRGTAKGSFNTPFAETMRELSSLNRACPGQSYVFTHDPVLTYLVEQSGGRVSSPYAPADANAILARERDCVLMIHTYRGVLAPGLFAQYSSRLDSEHFRKIRTINLGYDRFHAIKTWVGNELFPKYYITIDAYDVLHDVSIPDWFRLQAPR
jgi:hypothetical protein